jgi:transposase
MVDIEHIDDREQLRQVALLLDRENQKLHDKIRALAAEIAKLKGQSGEAAQLELAYLRELLAARERALFAEKSERRPQTDGASPTAPEGEKVQRGHGARAQSKLPIVETVHELPAAEKACPQCGGELSEMSGQSEDSEEITVVERRFVLVKHRRKKYRCACNGHVATAPGPLKLSVRDDARGSRYSIDFAIEVAVAKYLDHLPLERQVRMMAREGLEIESQTLWDQIEALARSLGPTYEALRRHVLAAPLVGADETWWRLTEGKGSNRWWAWTTASADAVSYRILGSRSQEAAREVLAGYSGIVMADGYGVYEVLAQAGLAPGFTLVHCWAHARRKFVEAEPSFPEPCREVLDLIGQLYGVEREAGASLEARAALRGARSKVIAEKIHSWALGQRALPQSSLGKAIAYMLGLWTGLTRFLDDPRIPLDNNATERALRGAVVGRKNHYGSRSRRGTEVAALFYSLLETAKLVGVEPKNYLREAAHAALRGQAVLLPHQLAG